MPVYVDLTLERAHADSRQIPDDDRLLHEIYDGMNVASSHPVVEQSKGANCGIDI